MWLNNIPKWRKYMCTSINLKVLKWRIRPVGIVVIAKVIIRSIIILQFDIALRKLVIELKKCFWLLDSPVIFRSLLPPPFPPSFTPILPHRVLVTRCCRFNIFAGEKCGENQDEHFNEFAYSWDCSSADQLPWPADSRLQVSITLK